jgi:hypothetical protein
LISSLLLFWISSFTCTSVQASGFCLLRSMTIKTSPLFGFDFRLGEPHAVSPNHQRYLVLVCPHFHVLVEHPWLQDRLSCFLSSFQAHLSTRQLSRLRSSRQLNRKSKSQSQPIHRRIRQRKYFLDPEFLPELVAVCSPLSASALFQLMGK